MSLKCAASWKKREFRFLFPLSLFINGRLINSTPQSFLSGGRLILSNQSLANRYFSYQHLRQISNRYDIGLVFSWHFFFRRLCRVCICKFVCTEVRPILSERNILEELNHGNNAFTDKKQFHRCLRLNLDWNKQQFKPGWGWLGVPSHNCPFHISQRHFGIVTPQTW